MWYCVVLGSNQSCKLRYISRHFGPVSSLEMCIINVSVAQKGVIAT